MEVRTEGPIFDGRAETILRDYCEHAEEDIAKEGHTMLSAAFAQTSRHPSGFYESHVEVKRDNGGHVVTDNGVVYGPWLEGTGSRNETTRFKGYANFRRTAEELQGKAIEIAERDQERYLREM
jgi:hypothetical protein